jgi:MFS family permease
VLLSAIWSTFGLICSFAGFLFVDRLARPRLLAMGLGGCVCCLIILAALVANFGQSHNFPALKTSVAMIFIYEFFWCGVLSGTQFVYCGELFPSHIRAKGLSLGVAGINLANIVFLTVAPTAFAYSTHLPPQRYSTDFR